VVYKILRGKDSGWNPQSRDDGALSLQQAYQAHRGHTLFGIVLGGIAYLISLELFLWLLPIAGCLMLSIPLSWLSGGEKRGRIFNWLGLFRSPEEKHPAEILKSFRDNTQNLRPMLPVDAPLQFLNNNQPLFCWHLAQLPLLDAYSPGEFHAPTVTAKWKLEQAATLQELQAWLDPPEMLALLSQHSHIQKLRENGLVELS
jgi:membrane glycosyltransferase